MTVTYWVTGVLVCRPVVKPPAFEYVAAASLDEALACRTEHEDESVVLAGGQSLIPLMSLRMALPSVVIDIGPIRELAYIRDTGGGVAIGAMTRQRDLERSDLMAERFPLFAQALARLAHPAIRNRGTLGGSLAHADPAAELPTVAVALDAEIVLRSVGVERVLSAADFFRATMTTAIDPEELVVEVRVPSRWERRPDRTVRSSFKKLARRDGDFALVGIASVVAISALGTIEDARLVLSGVGGTPVRARGAEDLLRGTEPTAATLTAAARRAAADLDPSGDLHATAEYRRRAAGVLARRALEEAVA